MGTSFKPSALLFATALTASIFTPSARADNPVLPSTIQSVAGDVVSIQAGLVPTMQLGRGADRSSQQAVELCLRNAANSMNIMAIDVRPANPPRHVTTGRKETCLTVQVVPQKLYFWKGRSIHSMKLVLTARFDLRHTSGTKVLFEWIVD